MASINDLATAATIASSAVALQQGQGSSPSQPQQQQQSPQNRPEAAAAVAREGLPASPSPAHAAAPSAEADVQPQASGDRDTDYHRDSINAAAAAAAAMAAARSGAAAAAAAAGDAGDAGSSPSARAGAPAPLTPPRAPASLVADSDAMDGVEETGPAIGSGGGAPYLSTPFKPTIITTTTTTAADSVKGKGRGEVADRRERPVRGALIVFEGMDRAGKTTQAKLLQVRCIEGGRDVRFMRFPGGFTSSIGLFIHIMITR